MKKKLYHKLPDTVEGLKDLILDFQHENERLQEVIKLLQLRKFGKKSEQSDSKQLNIFDITEDDLKYPEEEEKKIIIKSHNRKKSRALPKELPREIIYYDLSEEDKICNCGKELNKMGEDKYEQLEFIPAQLKVIEHVKFKYACNSCKECIKIAKSPKQPIPKSIASAGLLSQIIVSKYVDHLPLYRQESILTRGGIDLPRATLSNWIFKCADLLKPLVDKLKDNIIQSNYVRADETTVNVISEQAERSKCYMWVFMNGPPDKQSVIFEYNNSRASDVPNKFLQNFSGYLQTDGYGGYNDLKNKNEITSLGCWAHSRRKFFEITKISKKAGSAHIAVNFINNLYKIEKEIKSKQLNFDEIKKYRQDKSIPILDEFKIWLDKTMSRVPPTFALGKAISYTLNNWNFLNNYCLDGKLDIDNNAIERMIKPFACGRKNWMFQGNVKGAQASAILYSLVQTCKVNNVNPYDFFRFALEKIPNLEAEYEIEQLLPYNFVKNV